MVSIFQLICVLPLLQPALSIVYNDSTLTIRTLDLKYPNYTYGGASGIYNNKIYYLNAFECVTSDPLTCGTITQDKLRTLDISSAIISNGNITMPDQWQLKAVADPFADSYSQMRAGTKTSGFTSFSESLWILFPGGGQYQSNRALQFDMSIEQYENVGSYDSQITLGLEWQEACNTHDDLYLYAVGGKYPNPDRRSNRVYRYHVANNEWDTLQNMALNRSSPSCTVVDGNLYVLGGQTGGDKSTRTTSIIGYISNSWQSVGDLLIARNQHKSFTHPNNWIITIGGRDTNSDPVGLIEIFNPLTLDNVRTEMIYQRKSFGSVINSIGSNQYVIYLWGGSINPGGTGTQVYDDIQYIILSENDILFPTISPTYSPSDAPSIAPSIAPTAPPTSTPSFTPTTPPSLHPSVSPSISPTSPPTLTPSNNPTNAPSIVPSNTPSSPPSNVPSNHPSNMPSIAPSNVPSSPPSNMPSSAPSNAPTNLPSFSPSLNPSFTPSFAPTDPTNTPTNNPTDVPTLKPTQSPLKGNDTHPPIIAPSIAPSAIPSSIPTYSPSIAPTNTITNDPTYYPSVQPSDNPSTIPTDSPTLQPSPPPIHIAVDPTASPTFQPTPETTASAEEQVDTTYTLTLQPISTSSATELKYEFSMANESDALNQAVTYMMIGLVCICLFFIIISWSANSFIYKGCDPPNYFAILWVIMEIYDFMSDVSFSVYLWFLKDDITDEGIVTVFIFASIFIYVPYLLNLAYLTHRIRRWKFKLGTSALGQWLSYWDWWLIILAMLTGGSHPSVELCNSLLFPMDAFGMHLPWNEIVKIRKERFCTTVLFENVPQLIIQLYLLIAVTNATSNQSIIYLTIISSIGSIAFSGLYYFVNSNRVKLAKNHWIFRMRLTSLSIAPHHKHSYYKLQLAIQSALELPNAEWVRITNVQHKLDVLRCDGFISIPDKYLIVRKKGLSDAQRRKKEDKDKIADLYQNTFDDQERNEFQNKIETLKNEDSHYHQALLKQIRYDIQLQDLKVEFEIGGANEREGGRVAQPLMDPQLFAEGDVHDDANNTLSIEPGINRGGSNISNPLGPGNSHNAQQMQQILNNGNIAVEMVQHLKNNQRSLDDYKAPSFDSDGDVDVLNDIKNHDGGVVTGYGIGTKGNIVNDNKHDGMDDNDPLDDISNSGVPRPLKLNSVSTMSSMDHVQDVNNLFKPPVPGSPELKSTDDGIEQLQQLIDNEEFIISDDDDDYATPQAPLTSDLNKLNDNDNKKGKHVHYPRQKTKEEIEDDVIKEMTKDTPGLIDNINNVQNANKTDIDIDKIVIHSVDNNVNMNDDNITPNDGD